MAPLNIPLLVFVFIVFALIIISYTFEKLDFVAISIVLSFTAATVTGILQGLTINDFLQVIEFEAILVILSMSIITKIAQDSNILEFLAVKLFKLSKGNQRVFFYFLCVITTLLAAIITDVVVVLILGPVVIRLCRFLKIRAGTYLLGMTVCINIGSIITPFSSGENIIISTAFGLDTLYFIQNYWIFSFSLLFITIFLIDKFYLSKEPKIEEQQKRFVLELIDADTMVSNKKMFYFNSVAIIVTIALFAILPLLYLTAVLSAFLLVIINKRFTKKKAAVLLKDVEWEIIFFFLSLYIVIGCLLEAGFKEIFINIPFQVVPPILISLIILIAVSLISGFVANTPTALVFIPIIETLTNVYGFASIPIYFAFIIGINIGGNLIPQGAACDVMTLKIAQDAGVENFNYKRLLKVGATFAIIHIILSTVYSLILAIFFS
ncbi:MAG: Arsenical pump membrane protein [Promethearchaeota archaeon]|nr:MAG: Arsenical pump membrane protein [Candidatus Lokiarchaeota archaeon]